ncbi:dUTPase domain-containing protein [Trichonephila clavata]|uniref:Deoxyuridine 5'-triphosphate nucleotidohydrolase n=1 Tax=Trichonephila clavata TaxID=2740835 RepID=A0A8X6LGM8_TRICU|nr:dUTPase domain-containing protein [Trichonephila clavata]
MADNLLHVAPVRLESFPIQLELPYEKIRREALDPFGRNDGSCGVDLASPNFYTMDPLQQVKIYTGLAFEFKAGWTAFLKDKSSVVTRKHLVVEGGVIDPGYRGEIIVVMRNLSQNTQFVRPGDLIAQMVNVYTGLTPKLVQVSHVKNDTQRGTRGFGGDVGHENFMDKSNSSEEMNKNSTEIDSK